MLTTAVCYGPEVNQNGTETIPRLELKWPLYAAAVDVSRCTVSGCPWLGVFSADFENVLKLG